MTLYHGSNVDIPLFRQFSDGLISVETLVNEMEFKKLTDQYSFHTEKALLYLLKTGVENV